MDVLNSYKRLDISIPSYALRVILPALFFGLLVSLILGFTLPWIFIETYFVIILYFLPVFTTIVALFYPVIKEEIKSVKIDREMHLFITRLGALSASEISEKGFRDLFAEMKKYGVLGDEIRRLEKLSSEWNMSLSEAARTISKNTPSEMLSDFLERLAYALETQTSPKEFFQDEQETVMDDYSNEFEDMLFRLDVVRELYVAGITICLFGMVLAVITPLLIQINAELLITLVFFIFVLVTFISGWVFLKIIPKTRVWYKGEFKTEVDEKLKKLFILSVMISGAISIPLVFLTDLSFLPLAAIISTPLMIPGIFAILEEKKIFRRDSNFPSFIRSLAGTSAAQTADHTESVGKLRYHDLGPLTDNIRSLYRRLKMNIDSKFSWEYFGSEAKSFLIDEFSSIFLKASRHGAHPEETSSIISENFIEVMGLRNKKILRAKSLQSVFYGVAVVITLTMVFVFLIVEEINELIGEIDMPAGIEGMFTDLAFIRTAPIQIEAYYGLIVMMVFAHGITASAVSWHIKGEHKYISIAKFSIMIWMATIAYFIAKWGVSVIF